MANNEEPTVMAARRALREQRLQEEHEAKGLDLTPGTGGTFNPFTGEGANLGGGTVYGQVGSDKPSLQEALGPSGRVPSGEIPGGRAPDIDVPKIRVTPREEGADFPSQEEADLRIELRILKAKTEAERGRILARLREIGAPELPQENTP